jgi:OmpA-OmpF porin, OOP family
MSVINFDSIQDYITPDVLHQSSKFLNEFENSISKAINLAIPIVLNQLLDNADNKDIVDVVYDKVSKIEPISDKVLKHLASTLSDNSPVTNVGINFLELFFDSKQDIISKKISGDTFITIASANSVIKMTSLLILCYLAKKNVGAKDLKSYFEKQNADEIEVKEPKFEEVKVKKEEPKIVEIPKKEAKFEKVEEKKAIVSASKIEPVKEVAEIQKPAKKSNLKVIFAIIAIVAIGLFAYVMTSKENDVDEIKENNYKNQVDTETQPQPIEGTDVTTLGDFIDFTLPSDDIITIPEKGIEKSFLDLILDNSKSLDESSWWLSLDRINFDARETDFRVDSEEQIKNISLIMASFPKTKITIASYTDNLGKPENNLKLSLARAESLRLALIKLGVQGDRITAEGFGQEFAITPNATDDDRKQNRRISIKLTQK